MAGADTGTHQYLRAWRKRRNMTLEEVSEIIGSKVNTISGWENGKRRVNLDDLSRLAAIYGVSAADLLQSPETYDEQQASTRFKEIANRLTSDQAAHLFWLAEEMIFVRRPREDPPSATASPQTKGAEPPSRPFPDRGNASKKPPIQAADRTASPLMVA